MKVTESARRAQEVVPGTILWPGAETYASLQAGGLLVCRSARLQPTADRAAPLESHPDRVVLWAFGRE